MQVLDKVIKKNGYVYEQVKRTRYVAMYKQEDTGYEVFVIRVEPEERRNVFGKWYDLPKREVFPQNEEFGRYAWSYNSLEKAEEKYKLLNRVVRTKYKSTIFALNEYPSDG